MGLKISQNGYLHLGTLNIGGFSTINRIFLRTQYELLEKFELKRKESLYRYDWEPYKARWKQSK